MDSIRTLRVDCIQQTIVCFLSFVNRVKSTFYLSVKHSDVAVVVGIYNIYS